MKHLIIALAIILLVAFLVLPLVLISMNKLHNPFETFAVKNKTGLISQNYVPLSADTAPEGQKGTVGELFDRELEKKCAAGGRTLLPAGVTKLFDKKSGHSVISSNEFGFSWSLNGAYEEFGTAKDRGTSAVLFYGGNKDDTKLGISLWAGKYATKECSDYYKRTFDAYQNAGRFFEGYAWEKNGYILIEKGLSNISGHNYYWYVFENTNLRGEKLPESETGGSLLTDKMYSNQVYTAVFDTFSGNTHYRVTFNGDKKTNKSYRNVIQTASYVLAGLSLK